MTPDVHFSPVERALATPHAPCEPPSAAFTAWRALEHRDQDHAEGTRAVLRRRMPRQHTASDVHVEAPPRFRYGEPPSHAAISPGSDWDGSILDVPPSDEEAAADPARPAPQPLPLPAPSTAAGPLPANVTSLVLEPPGADAPARRPPALVVAGSLGRQGLPAALSTPASPMRSSCAAGRHRFLCPPSSDVCLAQAAQTPLRRRSSFARVFVSMAGELWDRDRHGGVGSNETSAAFASAVERLWNNPCLVLSTSKCHSQQTGVEEVAKASAPLLGRGDASRRLDLPGVDGASRRASSSAWRTELR